jgi:hypothetical protein
MSRRRSIGADSGVSFAHYPPSVREVLAVEPEPTLREQARPWGLDLGSRR